MRKLICGLAILVSFGCGGSKVELPKETYAAPTGPAMGVGVGDGGGPGGLPAPPSKLPDKP